MDLMSELSATNALQLRALELLAHPRIRIAKEEGERELVASLPFVDPKSREVFPEASREISIAALLFALLDPEDPIVLCTELMPRVVKGIVIPGSRALDDNPDTVYRFMPIAEGGRYTITVRTRPERPIIHQFSLISENWVTMQNFAAENVACDENGSFTIELDPDPAAGRTNHIRIEPGASFLHVRDTLADWSRQMPSLLEIRRLNPPTRGPLAPEELIKKCVAYISNWYKKTIMLHEEAVSRPANAFPQPMIRKTIAMLVTQAYSIGRFDLAGDQAVVLTLRLGGARYLVVPVTNLWGITNDPVGRQASLNDNQAARNADGSYTFVLSLKDPGVVNWIDPGDLPQGLLFLRWAAIDADYKGTEIPSVESVTIPIKDLDQFVPATMPKVNLTERATQVAERISLYERRWG